MAETLVERTAAVTEALTKVDDPVLGFDAIIGFERLIGEAESQDRNIVFHSGDSALSIIRYAAGDRAWFTNYDNGLILLIQADLVLSTSVRIGESTDTSRYDQELYVGDSQFLIRAVNVAKALRNRRDNAYLEVINSWDAELIGRHTDEHVVPLIG